MKIEKLAVICYCHDSSPTHPSTHHWHCGRSLSQSRQMTPLYTGFSRHGRIIASGRQGLRIYLNFPV